MTSKTGIPEALVAGISGYIALWLSPAVFSIQQFVLNDYYKTMGANNNEYMTLTLLAAACVLAIGAYLLLSAYCASVVIEKIYFFLRGNR